MALTVTLRGTAHQYGGASSITTPSFTPAAGSLLVAVLPWNNSGSTFTSITTSTGETFAIDKTFDAVAGFPSGKIASKLSTAGGSMTVTAQWTSGAVGSAELLVYEVTGAATASAFDGSDAVDGGISAGSIDMHITTAQADEVIFALLEVYNSSPTVSFSTPAGFTIDKYDADADKGYAAWKVVSATQSNVLHTWTLTGTASRSIGMLASYKAAAAATVGPPVTPGFFSPRIYPRKRAA